MNKLGLGVIGCGEIAKFMMVFARLNPKVRILGFTDLNLDKAQKFASYFRGARAFTDYREMVDSLPLDAAYIALPHHLHYPVMKELIPRKIPVFCEKPITSKLDDALEITQLAREHNVKVGVNYQYRYDKSCYRMAMAAQKGDLGELYFGTCLIPWHRKEKYFLNSKWHAHREQSGGGTLITQGSHGLDILLWSFGYKPVRALGVSTRAKFAGIGVEDLCMGIVELENGALLQINSSMVANPEQPVSINIFGSKGTAQYTGGIVFSRVKFLKARVPPYKPNAGGIHPLARSLEAFRRWVIHDAPYHNKAEDTLPVLSTITAIYESCENTNGALCSPQSFHMPQEQGT